MSVTGNKLITFERGMDIRCREPKRPTVARFIFGNGECRFVVIGTDYGYIHNTSGEVRTWRSYSGARRAARAYRAIWVD